MAFEGAEGEGVSWRLIEIEPCDDAAPMLTSRPEVQAAVG